VTVLDDISTLRNRVCLWKASSETADLNPAIVLDIVSYLNILDDTYSADKRCSVV
jgi:hypothetical protein